MLSIWLMSVISFLYAFISKDDRLPNLDATQQGTDTENKEEDIAPTRERKHFPSNISKTGYAIFSVSYSNPVTHSYVCSCMNEILCIFYLLCYVAMLINFTQYYVKDLCLGI